MNRIGLRQGIAALILAGAWVLSAPGALAQNHSNYRIMKVDHFLKSDPRAGARVWVQEERAWKPGQEQIDVTVAVGHDVSGTELYLRVYFFDADNHLVEKKDHPNNLEILTAPERTIAFAMPHEMTHAADIYAKFTTPAAKWTHAVVVFGDAETAAAHVIPGGDLTDFDVPEKAQIVAGQ